MKSMLSFFASLPHVEKFFNGVDNDNNLQDLQQSTSQTSSQQQTESLIPY